MAVIIQKTWNIFNKYSKRYITCASRVHSKQNISTEQKGKYTIICILLNLLKDFIFFFKF